MSARVSKPCKVRPELEAMIEKARGVETGQSRLEAVARNVLASLPADPGSLTRDQLIHLVEMTRRLLEASTES